MPAADRHRHAARAPRCDLRKRGDEALEALRIGELLQPRVVDRCSDGDREAAGVAREDGELHPAEIAGDDAGRAAGRAPAAQAVEARVVEDAGILAALRGGGCSERRQPSGYGRAPAQRVDDERGGQLAPVREPDATNPGSAAVARAADEAAHADAFPQLDLGSLLNPARRAHSNVVRRHARSTTSSSAGSGSNPIPGAPCRRARSRRAVVRESIEHVRQMRQEHRAGGAREGVRVAKLRHAAAPPRAERLLGVVHVGAHVALEHQHAREVTRQQPGRGESGNAAAQHDGGSRRDRFETRHRRGDTGSGQPCRVRRCLERARRVGSARGS